MSKYLIYLDNSLKSLSVSIKSVYNQSIGLLLGVPYMLWRLFGSRSKKFNGDKTGIKFLLRKILELNKTKSFIGINLALLLLLFSIFQSSIDFTKANEIITEPSHLVSETNMSTETTFKMPVIGYVSQNYSWYHPGVDIAGNENCEVFPVSSGKVAKIGYSRFGYGINIVIDHGNNILSRYAHLKAVNVKVGQNIEKGTIIGYVGSTGWSTGPHLHLEVYMDKDAVNPLSVLPGTYQANYIDLKAKDPDNTLIALAQQKVELADETNTSSMSANVGFEEEVEDYVEPQAYKYSATNSAELSANENILEDK